MTRMYITSKEINGKDIIYRIRKHFVYSLHYTDLLVINQTLTARIISSIENTVIIETSKTSKFITDILDQIFKNEILIINSKTLKQ